MAPIQVFVQTRRPHRSYGYYCAICPFSSGGNIIQKKLDPVPGWTCAQEAFPVVLSLMAYRISNIAKIFGVNQQGVLEKQLDPGR